MKKKFSLATVIVLVALSVLITFQLTYIKIDNKYKIALNEIKDSQLVYDKLASVDAVYRKQYIGEIDETSLVDSVIRGYVEGTGDTYGAYYTEEEFKEIVQDTNAEFVGVGIHVIYDYETDVVNVVNIMPGSPAEEAGMKPGDIIAYVDSVSVRELGYFGMLAKIRGEEKTLVNISVLRDGELIDLEVERRKITDYTVYSRVYSKDSTVGIIQIYEFDMGTVQQFKAAVKELTEQGVDKLVFDVRNNPGGNLESIEEILDYLLPEGPIIRIYDKSGKEEVLTSDASGIDCQMMVLTNGNTASAAELFSSALRDYEKALLVGEKTYGKGSMQTILSLHDGSAISVSTNMYAPPFSDNYDGVGIEPDIKVSLPDELANKSVYLISDEEDTQLLAAVEAFGTN